jgi:subtilisin family serine protease
MGTFWITVVDSAYRPIDGAHVSAATVAGSPFDLHAEGRRHVGHAADAARLIVSAAATGYEAERYATFLRGAVTQIVIGLRRANERSYSRGVSRLSFAPARDTFLVRVRGSSAGRAFADVAHRASVTYRLPSKEAEDADDILVRVEAPVERATALIEALAQRAQRVDVMLPIEHGSHWFGLTNQVVARFSEGLDRADIERMAHDRHLTIAESLLHVGNAFLLAGPRLDYGVLDAADALARDARVIYAEPNLTFPTFDDAYVPDDVLWPDVKHLRLIGADEAWDLLDDVVPDLRGGSPDITVAIIDPNGVTPDQPDLTATLTNASAKLLVDYDFVLMQPQTVAALGSRNPNHGTQCAGSAAAAFDDQRGLPGVAPNCHLIGARIGSTPTDVDFFSAYLWAAGFHAFGAAAPNLPPRPADVISSSWGAEGGASALFYECIDFLTTYGRGGKGCLLCFSISDNGYVDFTDASDLTNYRAWATYEKTIAVGASINADPIATAFDSFHADENGATQNLVATVDRRALYSPYGNYQLWKPDLVAPSHTALGVVQDPQLGELLSFIDPILACVRVNDGQVNGCTGGAVCTDYAWSFGGTSHSAPTVAGAIALVLSAQPGLTWIEVRDILRASCARIDNGQANAVGQWRDLDLDGVKEYSQWYGAGRLDVAAAVTLALDATRPLADVYARDNVSDTGAVPSSSPWWESPDIWVRQDAQEPIPALAWDVEPPHQDVLRGQDNALFCRLRNASPTVAASSVYVRALVAHWPGLDFVYPEDFEPDAQPGTFLPAPLQLGTYLIGEKTISPLPPNADAIVKFVWDKALIPPANVAVGSLIAQWHPCLLLELSPHDGPPAVGQPSAVAGDNNLAQRNVAIVDALEALPDVRRYVFVVTGIRRGPPVERLVIDPRRLRNAGSIMLHVPESRLMHALWEGVQRAARDPALYAHGTPAEDRDSGRGMEKGFAPSRERDGAADLIILNALAARIEIPFELEAGRFAPLLIGVRGRSRGDLWISQRRRDGALSPGYGIRFRE